MALRWLCDNDSKSIDNRKNADANNSNGNNQICDQQQQRQQQHLTRFRHMRRPQVVRPRCVSDNFQSKARSPECMFRRFKGAGRGKIGKDLAT